MQRSVSAGHKGTHDDLLGKASLHGNPNANNDTVPGGAGEAALKIVDFVPPAVVAEEEAALGEGRGGEGRGGEGRGYLETVNNWRRSPQPSGIPASSRITNKIACEKS